MFYWREGKQLSRFAGRRRIMTYKAIDIARYVINYLEDSGRHISNLKL